MEKCEESSSSITCIKVEFKGEVNKSFTDDNSGVVTDDEKIKHQGEHHDDDDDDDDEEFILSKLREVVRKCNQSDPNKRPTAEEVLHILTKTQ